MFDTIDMSEDRMILVINYKQLSSDAKCWIKVGLNDEMVIIKEK